VNIASPPVRFFCLIALAACLGGVGCERSRVFDAEDLEVRLAATDSAQDTLRNLEPAWVQSRQCNSESADFNECSAWVYSQSGRTSISRSAVYATSRTPKLLTNLNAQIVQTRMTGPQSGRSVVLVTGTCNYSTPALLLGRPLRCNPSQPFQVRVTVDVLYKRMARDGAGGRMTGKVVDF
jgi:hypothetical protein